MKAQRRGGEASQLNGSVLECRLRLPDDRPLGTGKERQRFKVGVRGAALKAAPGQRGVWGECDVPVGPAGFVPGLISSHLGSAGPMSFSMQRAGREAGILRAHAPPGRPWGQRSWGRSRKVLGWAPGIEVSGEKKWAH